LEKDLISLSLKEEDLNEDYTNHSGALKKPAEINLVKKGKLGSGDEERRSSE